MAAPTQELQITSGGDAVPCTLIGGTKTATAAAVADAIPVAAAVAVLVADGATPTQAHVTTLNAAWATLNTAITAADTAAGGATGGGLVLFITAASVVTKSNLKKYLNALWTWVDGSDLLTP